MNKLEPKMNIQEIIGYLGSILNDEDYICEGARSIVENVYKTLLKGKQPTNEQIQALVAYMDEKNMSPYYFQDYKIATEALTILINEI